MTATKANNQITDTDVQDCADECVQILKKYNIRAKCKPYIYQHQHGAYLQLLNDHRQVIEEYASGIRNPCECLKELTYHIIKESEKKNHVHKNRRKRGIPGKHPDNH